jgi:hypothetical protein
MNKYLLISLCLFANTAFATWTFVGKNNVGTIFYEYESVKKDGDLISVTLYIDFNKRQETGEMSGLYHMKFQCGKANEVIVTYAKLFNDIGLRNFISEASGEMKLDPGSNSPYTTLYKFLCHL